MQCMVTTVRRSRVVAVERREFDIICAGRAVYPSTRLQIVANAECHRGVRGMVTYAIRISAAKQAYTRHVRRGTLY